MIWVALLIQLVHQAVKNARQAIIHLLLRKMLDLVSVFHVKLEQYQLQPVNQAVFAVLLEHSPM